MSYLGEDFRKLGFGMMRLPKNGDEFDLEQIKKMVDRFLDAGFRYFDTAYIYQGSEDVTRKALVERYPRDRYMLTSKLAVWEVHSREEAEAQFKTSLSRCGVDYFDFYLLHNMGPGRTNLYDEYDIWSLVQELKAKGLIRHFGFSFHDTPEELEKLLTAHPEAEFVQLQLNYVDWDSTNVRARENYEVCRRHGKPVIIMEPVKGGLLANPPKPIAEIFKAAEPDSSPASWALRYAADLEGIVTVLSGMSSLEQMEDNLATMTDFTHLNDAEKQVIQDAVAAFEKIPTIQCTACDYCAKACPMNIGISGIFRVRNSLSLYNNPEKAASRLAGLEKDGKAMAADCIRCCACESVCPQNLPIPDLLAECADAFSTLKV